MIVRRLDREFQYPRRVDRWPQNTQLEIRRLGGIDCPGCGGTWPKAKSNNLLRDYLCVKCAEWRSEELRAGRDSLPHLPVPPWVIGRMQRKSPGRLIVRAVRDKIAAFDAWEAHVAEVVAREASLKPYEPLKKTGLEPECADVGGRCEVCPNNPIVLRLESLTECRVKLGRKPKAQYIRQVWRVKGAN